MRILRGSLKGRNILVCPDIRPVLVRVRKSCFDIIIDLLPQARVLDLFAGAGTLGIEALSCGVKEAVFIDTDRSCIDTIKRNLLSFGIEHQAKVYSKDAFRAIEDFYRNKEKFDLIFLDPPYYKGMLIKALQSLGEHDILCPSGYIVGFSYIKDNFLAQSIIFSLFRQKQYGQTQLVVYRKNE